MDTIKNLITDNKMFCSISLGDSEGKKYFVPFYIFGSFCYGIAYNFNSTYCKITKRGINVKKYHIIDSDFFTPRTHMYRNLWRVFYKYRDRIDIQSIDNELNLFDDIKKIQKSRFDKYAFDKIMNLDEFKEKQLNI
jgi:hypothetical protein